MTTSQAWPDYCCVPALVSVALEIVSGDDSELPTREELVEMFRIKAPAGSLNPFGLPEVEDINDAGVPLEVAVDVVRTMAKRYTFRFEFVAFDQVPFRDFEGLFSERSSDRTYIGAGVDWSIISGTDRRSKHMVHVREYSPQTVTIDDPSAGTDSTTRLDVAVFERAVRIIGDGFWIFEGERRSAR